MNDKASGIVDSLLKSRIFWVLAIVVVALATFTVFGFHTVPRIARSEATRFVSEQYGRDLRIGEIRFNPFKLQLEVRDLALPDTDGQTMLGFDRLFVDFELSSVWKRAFYFQELAIQRPAVRAVIRPSGEMNLSDLAPATQPEPEAEDSALPHIWLRLFDVSDGRLDFVDQARPEPIQWAFNPVTFRLEDFHTTPAGGDYELALTGERGAELRWKGEVALAPEVSSSGELSISGLQARAVAESLGTSLPFGVPRGVINFAGSYRLAIGSTTDFEVSLPRIEMTDLALRARGIEEDWVTIPNLVVSEIHLTSAGQRIEVGQIDLEGMAVSTWLDADGSVNLVRLVEPATTTPGPVTNPQEAAPAEPATAEPATAGATTELPEPVVAALPSEPPPATPNASEQQPPDKAEVTENASAEAGEWQVGIDQFRVKGAAIEFEDRMIAPGTRGRIAPLDVVVRDISLDLSQPLPIEITATVNDHALVKASGHVTPEPLAAVLDLNVSKARMQIMQPYILPVADLTIGGGILSADGKVELAPAGTGKPELAFDGELSVSGFKSIDNPLEEDFINFDLLQLGKLRYTMAPDAVTIDQILVRKPYARVIISPNQVLNIQAVLDPQGAAAALATREAAAEAARTGDKKSSGRKSEVAAKAAGKTQPVPAGRPAAETGMPIRVGELKLENGQMNFSDLFIQPNFSADVTSLSGRVTGISSDPKSRARVDLKGKLGKFSPVTIKGELQPFAFDSFTDIDMTFADIALPVFNPYSGRLAGFNIAQGMLTTELEYLIQNRVLDARHHIVIEQLEWGEATANKEAVTLPVKLATSLLKDANGVIDLNVPVGGTLDDPTFKIGPIIWDIIKNLIVKAVTAPFKFLGSLFEGAEEAQFVDFQPGEADLPPDAMTRLGALAEALKQRPQLGIEVPIGALEAVDGPALSERRYEQQLESATRNRQLRKGKDESAVKAYEDLSDGTRASILEGILKKQTGSAPKVPAPPEPPKGTSRAEARALADAAAVEFLEQEARSSLAATEIDLDELGQARSEAIRSALLENSGIDPGRVVPTRNGKLTEQDGKVRFELAIDTDRSVATDTSNPEADGDAPAAGSVTPTGADDTAGNPVATPPGSTG